MYITQEKIMINELAFKDWNCKIVYGYYTDRNKMIALKDKETQEPIATCTVNMPEQMKQLEDALGDIKGWDKIKPTLVFIKDYSENKGMIKALEEAGMLLQRWAQFESGFVMIPVYELTPLAMEGWN
jgi:hypothetical protein